MKKKVFIKLKNRQEFLENKNIEEVEKDYQGEFYKKRDKFYLSYIEDSEGIEGAKTILKIDPHKKRVLLLRQKPAEMKQDFQTGEKQKGYFDTEYGRINLSVKTDSLKIDISKDAGIISINYKLYLSGELSSEHSLSLSFSSGKN